MAATAAEARWGTGRTARGGTAAEVTRWVPLGAAWLLVLNLLDGLFTLVWLQLGVAEEANPLLRAAYQQSPLLFMGVKLAAVQAGVYLLCRHAQARLSRFSLQLALCVYAAILTYHLAFALHLAVNT